MTEQEMKRLKRVQLLEILFEQSCKIDQLEEELAATKKQLAQKKILIDEAGSIAEAALRLNRVFEDAQKAADQYLENIYGLENADQTAISNPDKELS